MKSFWRPCLFLGILFCSLPASSAEPLASFLDRFSIELPPDSANVVLADRKNGVFSGNVSRPWEATYSVAEIPAFGGFLALAGTDGDSQPCRIARQTLHPYGVETLTGEGHVLRFVVLEGENGLEIDVTTRAGKVTLAPAGMAAWLGEVRDVEVLSEHTSLVWGTSGRGVALVARHGQVKPPLTLSVPDHHRLLPAAEFGGHGALVVLFDADRSALRKRAVAAAKDVQGGLRRKTLAMAGRLATSRVDTENRDFDKALAWSLLSGASFVNTRFGGLGIYAGFPWFQQNWGRDSFISLPGISLVSGRFAEAKEILRSFAAYQDRNPASPTFGRIPNRVQENDVIYNTADGTPWMLRQAYEYLQYSGDREFAREIFAVAKLSIQGAERNFVDAEGFLTHDDADTWMDARIEGRQPWSPRGNRAVEIQALWYNQLQISARLAALLGEDELARDWGAKASRLRSAFVRRFWNASKGMLFDRVTADGREDARVRPNQLLVQSALQEEPLLSDEQSARMVKETLSRLMYPYGIASLEKDDPYYHPYHEAWDWYHKDAAYHNGTIWGWTAGPALSSLLAFGHVDTAFSLTKNLVSQILEQGYRGTLSENSDATPQANGIPRLTGTFSQAWSVAEFTRVFYQDYAGIRPDLLAGRLTLRPRLPAELGRVQLRQPLGSGHMEMTRELAPGKERFLVNLSGMPPLTLVFVVLDSQGAEWEASWQGDSSTVVEVVTGEDGPRMLRNGMPHSLRKVREPWKARLGPVEFASPAWRVAPRSIEEKDFLRKVILENRWELPER